MEVMVRNQQDTQQESFPQNSGTPMNAASFGGESPQGSSLASPSTPSTSSETLTTTESSCASRIPNVTVQTGASSTSTSANVGVGQENKANCLQSIQTTSPPNSGSSVSNTFVPKLNQICLTNSQITTNSHQRSNGKEFNKKKNNSGELTEIPTKELLVESNKTEDSSKSIVSSAKEPISKEELEVKIQEREKNPVGAWDSLEKNRKPSKQTDEANSKDYDTTSNAVSTRAPLETNNITDTTVPARPAAAVNEIDASQTSEKNARLSYGGHTWRRHQPSVNAVHTNNQQYSERTFQRRNDYNAGTFSESGSHISNQPSQSFRGTNRNYRSGFNNDKGPWNQDSRRGVMHHIPPGNSSHGQGRGHHGNREFMGNTNNNNYYRRGSLGGHRNLSSTQQSPSWKYQIKQNPICFNTQAIQEWFSKRTSSMISDYKSQDAQRNRGDSGDTSKSFSIRYIEINQPPTGPVNRDNFFIRLQQAVAELWGNTGCSLPLRDQSVGDVSVWNGIPVDNVSLTPSGSLERRMHVNQEPSGTQHEHPNAQYYGNPNYHMVSQRPRQLVDPIYQPVYVQVANPGNYAYPYIAYRLAPHLSMDSSNLPLLVPPNPHGNIYSMPRQATLCSQDNRLQYPLHSPEMVSPLNNSVDTIKLRRMSTNHQILPAVLEPNTDASCHTRNPHSALETYAVPAFHQEHRNFQHHPQPNVLPDSQQRHQSYNSSHVVYHAKTHGQHHYQKNSQAMQDNSQQASHHNQTHYASKPTVYGHQQQSQMFLGRVSSDLLSEQQQQQPAASKQQMAKSQEDQRMEVSLSNSMLSQQQAVPVVGNQTQRHQQSMQVLDQQKGFSEQHGQSLQLKGKENSFINSTQRSHSPGRAIEGDLAKQQRQQALSPVIQQQSSSIDGPRGPLNERQQVSSGTEAQIVAGDQKISSSPDRKQIALSESQRNGISGEHPTHSGAVIPQQYRSLTSLQQQQHQITQPHVLQQQQTTVYKQQMQGKQQVSSLAQQNQAQHPSLSSNSLQSLQPQQHQGALGNVSHDQQTQVGRTQHNFFKQTPQALQQKQQPISQKKEGHPVQNFQSSSLQQSFIPPQPHYNTSQQYSHAIHPQQYVQQQYGQKQYHHSRQMHTRHQYSQDDQHQRSFRYYNTAPQVEGISTDGGCNLVTHESKTDVNPNQPNTSSTEEERKRYNDVGRDNHKGSRQLDTQAFPSNQCSHKNMNGYTNTNIVNGGATSNVNPMSTRNGNRQVTSYRRTP